MGIPNQVPYTCLTCVAHRYLTGHVLSVLNHGHKESTNKSSVLDKAMPYHQ